MTEQLEYHIALHDSETEGLDRKKWLIDYFELYKTTLIWPVGLPPIKSCNVKLGTGAERFYSVYKDFLSEFEYTFDNEFRTLKFD